MTSPFQYKNRRGKDKHNWKWSRVSKGEGRENSWERRIAGKEGEEKYRRYRGEFQCSWYLKTYTKQGLRGIHLSNRQNIKYTSKRGHHKWVKKCERQITKKISSHKTTLVGELVILIYILSLFGDVLLLRCISYILIIECHSALMDTGRRPW